jgi:argininosuccinate synthase
MASGFSPEREALQALITETPRDVTGVVRLKLYKGNIIVAGRKKPKKPLRSKDSYDGRRRIGVRSNGCHRFHSAQRAAIEIARRVKVKR